MDETRNVLPRNGCAQVYIYIYLTVWSSSKHSLSFSSFVKGIVLFGILLFAYNKYFEILFYANLQRFKDGE